MENSLHRHRLLKLLINSHHLLSALGSAAVQGLNTLTWQS